MGKAYEGKKYDVLSLFLSLKILREKERKKKERKKKKDILTNFKRLKWPLRPNKRLHHKILFHL